MFELLAKETVKHTSEIAQQDESQKPLAYKHKWPPRWADTMSRKWVVNRDKCVREIRKFFGVLIGLGVNGSKHSVKEMMSDDWSVEVGWRKDPKLGITSDWFHAILHSLRCQSDDWMEQGGASLAGTCSRATSWRKKTVPTGGGRGGRP